MCCIAFGSIPPPVSCREESTLPPWSRLRTPAFPLPPEWALPLPVERALGNRRRVRSRRRSWPPAAPSDRVRATGSLCRPALGGGPPADAGRAIPLRLGAHVEPHSGFRVDPGSGLLEPCGSIPTETQPRGFALDPAGRFAVVAGEISNAVSSYAVDPATGILAPLARIEAGVGPNWVEIIDLP